MKSEKRKKILVILSLCIMFAASAIVQFISPATAYFVAFFDKSGVNSVMVELIFDHLDFDDADIQALGYASVDENGNEIPWGSEKNPYVISQKYHIQNLSVLQNAGFFEDRIQTDESGNPVLDGSGNTIPAQSYFLVCKPDGTPVAIDCGGMTIDPVGNHSQPFTGVIEGALFPGEASYKGYGVSVSTIANLTVNAKEDTPDLGFFGHAGYYGSYNPDTATLTGGYASEIRNLLLADVTISSQKSFLQSISEWWDNLFSDHTNLSEKRKETHHVGIVAGHAEFATIEDVSVYYSDGVAAFNLVSNESGSNTNYYSSTGLIGLLQYVNPTKNDDGSLDGSGGITDSDITGEGEGGGGGENGGMLTGYFLSEALFNEHEQYLKAQNLGKSDIYDVKDMKTPNGDPLFTAKDMKEKTGGIFGTTSTVTYYYFQDSVFTFAMSTSSKDSTTTDYVQKVWSKEPPTMYGTSSKDKLHYADDLNSTSRVSYYLEAITATSQLQANGYYLIGHYDSASKTLYIYNPQTGTSGTMISFANGATEIYTGTAEAPLSTAYFDSSEAYIKSINLIGTKKQFHDLAFQYGGTDDTIKTPSNGYKLGLTATVPGNLNYRFQTPTLYHGDAAKKTSCSLTNTSAAYFYNWTFQYVDNGRFTISNKFTLTDGWLSNKTTYGWAKLTRNGTTLTSSIASNNDTDIRSELALNASDYFTVFKVLTNTLDSSGENITSLGKVDGVGQNYELTPKNIIPTTKNENGAEVLDTLYEFDPSKHVLEYLGNGTYRLAPIRSYKLNNGKGDLLSSLNHITRLTKATNSNYQLNLFDEDHLLSFVNQNTGGVVGASIGINGTYSTIPAGMLAFEINAASTEKPSFINMILAVNPGQTGDGTVGLWFYDSDATISNFDLSNPDQSFALPISKTATSWENDNGYILHISERILEDQTADGKKIYRVAENADGTQENSYVYLGGEYAFIYYRFEATEPGIYFIGARGGPLSVAYFSVSGTAGAGSDGMTGSPLGYIDFVYDFNGNIITVDKLFTEEEQFISEEDYTQYYPSYLFVSMLPEEENGSIKKIQNEKVYIRRYISSQDTSGTKRHLKLTGQNYTAIREISDMLYDVQDDID